MNNREENTNLISKNHKPLRLAVKAVLFLTLALALGALVFVLYLTRPFASSREIEIVWVNEPHVASNYDVIVIGAEPEGIAAAVSAARNGMSTLLLEESSSLGGVMTLGMLNFIDMCTGRDGDLLTRGFFQEFYKGVGGSAFDITKAKNYFLELVTAEPLITLRTQADLVAPVMDGNTVTGVVVRENDGEIVYNAKRFIDATTDGDFAALSGAPYTYGGEDIGKPDSIMGVTLVFELSGVNWLKVYGHLNFQRVKSLFYKNSSNIGASAKAAWGYGDEGLAYITNDPLMRLRGFNAARQQRDSVLINALLVFGVDPLDEISYTEGMNRAVLELDYLLPYIRENYTGFENAELTAVASRLYVRESRHFIGEYQLTIDDVLENRDYWDKIAIGGYPADVQPSEDQPSGNVIGSPDRYAVPFRCLVPLDVDNLLIVGRSASFTSLAASSARVISLGMVCGQAAGAAAAQSISDSQGFRQMSGDVDAITKLQAALKSQGAFLEDFSIRESIMDHWAYDGIAALRRLGLMAGGYQNDYGEDTPITKWNFQYMLNGIISLTGNQFEYIQVEHDPTCLEIIRAVVVAMAILNADDNSFDIYIADSPFDNGVVYRRMCEQLRADGILTIDIEQYFADPNVCPNIAESAMLLANLYNYSIK